MVEYILLAHTLKESRSRRNLAIELKFYAHNV